MSAHLVTQIYPILQCSHQQEVRVIMQRLGVVRADTYNKLGSVQGWGLDWHNAYSIIRGIKDASEYQLPSKICEWTVNDVVKAILAQQEAARDAVIKQIYRKFKDETVRAELIKKLYSLEWLNDRWLHRQMRKAYKRGHTYVHNQIVYQNQGYTCKRINRHQVLVVVQGLERGKRVTLIVKSNRIIKGQIRLIERDGRLEIHGLVNLGEQPSQPNEYTRIIGVDKGYTEAFIDSDGKNYGVELGRKLTAKTKRIHKKNQERQQLWALYNKNIATNPKKAQTIKDNNLTRNSERRKLARDKSEIKGLIRHGVRQMLSTPTLVYAEDLSKHFTTKKHSKAVNRKLNSWMKGELQDSLESIALQTGSKIETVNPAYTSQVDSVTGTLLGSRNGNSFIRFTGDVLQADINAAKNILCRGTDTEICRYMKSDKVLEVLLGRTVRFLASFGWTVADAVSNGRLQSKFTVKATALEAEIAPCGVQGTSRKIRERRTKKSPPTVQAIQLSLWDISSHSENNSSKPA